jgi:hypothetical protein
MSVYLLWEWTNPKEEERNKKRLQFEVDIMYPYLEKKAKEGVKMKPLGLTDGTGRILTLMTFETMEDFAKVWDDVEFQKDISRFSYLVDNFTCRILRGVLDL